MKIVDRTTFLALPPGTLYAKIPMEGKHIVYDFGPIEIKGESTANSGDWFVQRLIGDFKGASDTEKWIDCVDGMIAGQSADPDYNIEGRDGLFDQHQLFAVFEFEDHQALIGRLQQALESYSV